MAVALVCATFPLIWIGGLVTTYKAGMAVPDWPTTYGYNLFLYPWRTWFYGPWDLFVEHGHRLFAAGVGLLTIALVAVVWTKEPRGWVRWLSVLALVAVIGQGALGGLRVIEDKIQLARIHGCVGPAFFALAVALAVFTSRSWRTARPRVDAAAPTMHAWALTTTLLAYVQLVLGSYLRHLPTGLSSNGFRLAFWLHLIVAGLLVVHVMALAWQAMRSSRDEAALVRPAAALPLLVLVQIALGSATWIAKYGWPAWFAEQAWAANHVVGAQSRFQALVTTAHVATGSLILAVALLVALRSLRLVRSPQHVSSSESAAMEVAR
jgi:cytochrome c oxidase assembly protein subunit 15